MYAQSHTDSYVRIHIHKINAYEQTYSMYMFGKQLKTCYLLAEEQFAAIYVINIFYD